MADNAISPSTLLISPDGTASAEFYRFLQEIAGSMARLAVPVGMVLHSPTGEVPDTYLACEGGTFSATEYPELADYLGGTTLPDYRDRVPRGAGTLAGAAGATQEDAIQNHDHIEGFASSVASTPSNGKNAQSVTNAARPSLVGTELDANPLTSSTGEAGRFNANETRVKAYVGTFVIKAVA